MRPLLPLALALAACGDGDPALPCGGDAGIGPDLGEVDTSDSHVLRQGDSVFLEIFLPQADELEDPDLVELELHAQSGVFAGGPPRPGSYALAGGETRFSSCGACVLLLVDRDPGTLRPSAYFMPRSGRLVLDAVDGRLAGALEDVTLRQVTIDFTDPEGPAGPSLQTRDVPGGCVTRIGRAAFDLPYED